MSWDAFVSGVITTMCIAIALFQLRFWTRTRDRIFLYFTVAFTLMALNRIGLSIVQDESETRTYLYVVRMIAFIIIIIGIWDKNRRARASSSSSSSSSSPPQ